MMDLNLRGSSLLYCVIIAVVISSGFATVEAAQKCVEGRCIALMNCPILLEKLHSKVPDPDEIKLLQQLTCSFNGSMPIVCCPVERNASIEPVSYDKIVGILSKENLSSKSRRTFESHENFRLFPSLTNCSNIVLAARIIGGREVTVGMYPWMAQIGYKGIAPQVIYGCAGTIINSRYVLTAAHCAQIGRRGLVRLAEHDTSVDPECYGPGNCIHNKLVKVEDVILHPFYVPRSAVNDIALLRLEEELSFTETDYIQPICLPFVKSYNLSNFPDEFSQQTVVAAGWGKKISNSTAGSIVLRDVQLLVMSNAECGDLYRSASGFKISKNQICAGGEPGRDTCDGDSGSPLMWLHQDSEKRNQEKIIQLGLASFGPVHCGSGRLPAVYTRISAYLHWILNAVQP